MDGVHTKVESEGDADTTLEKSSLEAAVIPKKPEETPFPDGGLRAWSVAAGSSAALFCTFGFSNAFGVFQEYYQTHQLAHESPSSIAWVGSIQIFLLLGGGTISGPLFDRYGEKTLYPGVILYIFSVMMTSLCTKLYQFMLAQGILTGIAMGMVLGPSMAATGQYFKKNRGAATGLCVAGSSLGGVIFPIALSKMFANPHLGFGWSVRICGFIMTALLLPTCIIIRARLPPRKGAFFLPAAFKNITYVSMIASMFFILMGMFVPIFYIPTFAVDNRMSSQLALYLPSILNGASLFGRIIPGILADRFGRLNMLTFSALTTGILIFCFPKAVSNGSIIAFSAIYGFFSGALISLASVCLLSMAKDPKDMGTYYGMGMAVDSIAALIGPPINGVLVAKYGSFDQASWFSGVSVVVGALGLVGTKWMTGKGMLSRS